MRLGRTFSRKSSNERTVASFLSFDPNFVLPELPLTLLSNPTSKYSTLLWQADFAFLSPLPEDVVRRAEGWLFEERIPLLEVESKVGVEIFFIINARNKPSFTVASGLLRSIGECSTRGASNDCALLPDLNEYVSG
jgi:hypothetical protein